MIKRFICAALAIVCLYVTAFAKEYKMYERAEFEGVYMQSDFAHISGYDRVSHRIILDEPLVVDGYTYINAEFEDGGEKSIIEFFPKGDINFTDGDRIKVTGIIEEMLTGHYMSDYIISDAEIEELKEQEEYTKVNVLLDGEEIGFDSPAIIKDERTIVPIRGIFEKLGYSVDWNGEDKSIVIYKGFDYIKMNVGQKEYYVNDEILYFDVAPQIINDRTLIPLRAISEGFGMKVGWDDDTKTASVESSGYALLHDENSELREFSIDGRKISLVFPESWINGCVTDIKGNFINFYDRANYEAGWNGEYVGGFGDLFTLSSEWTSDNDYLVAEKDGFSVWMIPVTDVSYDYTNETLSKAYKTMAHQINAVLSTVTISD